MSWTLSGSGHFNGDDGAEKEAKLIEDLREVFANTDLTGGGSVNFHGQFHPMTSLTMPKES